LRECSEPSCVCRMSTASSPIIRCSATARS
jgi:hypothetical protein